MADLDEELQERQEIEQQQAENFAAYQQQERLQQIQQTRSPEKKTADTAKKAQKWIKRYEKTAAVFEFLAASFPVWGTILGVLIIVMFVIIVLVAGCNQTGLNGVAARGVSTVAGIFGADICKSLAFNGGASGGAGGGASINSPPSSVPGDAAARALLLQYGITVNKADCTTPTQTSCTSLDNTKSAVINEIIAVAQACDISLGGTGTQNKCGVQVTGGSEAGHADNGTCSHADGDKMDVSASSALTTYIQNNFTSNIARGGAGGGASYSDPNITSQYVLESAPAHWDISVGCIG